MASTNAMGHHHEWQDRPPDGKIDLSKSWDEKYWDEEELAANFMYSSPEEISRLKNLLLNDPGFLTSTSWPCLTEWCSSCKSTRSVRLALPEEETDTALEEEEELVGATVEKVCSAPTYQNACTQTPKPKPRRRGGAASRMRRLLAFQAMLSVKRGLPLSRLLSHQKTDARSSRADFLRLQEESSSPILKVRKEMKTKEEENKEEAAKVDVKEKEEKSFPREGVPTSGSSIFTLRNSQSGVKTPPSNTNTTGPELSPFSIPPPPFFTPTFLPPHLTPQYCTTPVANWGYCGGCQCWGPVLPIWIAQS